MLHCALSDPFAQRPIHHPPPSSQQVRWENIYSQLVSIPVRQLLSNLSAELQMARVRNGQQSDLIRREAKREPSVAMLDIHAQKTLQLRITTPRSAYRAINRSMNENGRFELAICVSELESELFGQLDIELDGSALVIATNAILDQNVDFGSVESTVSLFDGVIQTEFL